MLCVHQIPLGDASGTTFVLPKQHTTEEVAQHYKDCTQLPQGSPAQVNASAWLSLNGFHTRIPPVLLFSWWGYKVAGARDMLKNIIYDVLHCFSIGVYHFGPSSGCYWHRIYQHLICALEGLLAYFEDAVILVIYNSWSNTEDGNAAVAHFEANIAAIPSFDTGFRLYRAYPGGYGLRTICNGNDRFFLLMMFIAAIGLNNTIIPNPLLRRVVLSALEAACVLGVLLRATALTVAGLSATYEAANRFMKLLLHDVFKVQQTSEWAIFKFHMLFHIINNLVRGAAGCMNSSKFEAALRIYMSRIAARSSSNHDILRDIARNYMNHIMTVLMIAKGGKAAAALASASAVPKKRNKAAYNSEMNIGEVTEVSGGGVVTSGSAVPLADVEMFSGPQTLSPQVGDALISPFDRMQPRPSPRELDAVRFDLAASGTGLGLESEAAAGIVERARWFSCARVSRPAERFVALVHTGATVELSSRNFAVVDPVTLRDEPSSARLGRVVAFFYADPPADGITDGLPNAHSHLPGPSRLQRKRTFVVVWPFHPQTEPQARTLDDNGMIFHTLRSPLGEVPMPQTGAASTRGRNLTGRGIGSASSRLPLEVYPLSAVLRAVRAFPADWPTLQTTQVHRFGTNVTDATSAHRKATAAAKTGDILVFWPPDRDTFLPPTVRSQWPLVVVDGANLDADSGSDEDSDD